MYFLHRLSQKTQDNSLLCLQNIERAWEELIYSINAFLIITIRINFCNGGSFCLYFC